MFAQLREALARNAVRVGDLFREWDDGNSGTVTRAEFHRGMRELGFEASEEAIDEVFNSWDPDGSGILELREVERQLRRGGDKTQTINRLKTYKLIHNYGKIIS